MPAESSTREPSSGGIRIGDVTGNVTVNPIGDVIGGDKIINFNTTILVSAEAVTQRPLVTTSPYRGLDRFEDRDKDLFFGRDQLIKSQLNKLGNSNILLVLGASGSGKSSVVRAGLIPTLTGLLGARFRYFTMVPDANPLESLRSALHNGGQSQAETLALADPRPGMPTRLIHALQRKGDQWLIFVDQFEEIFTLSDIRLRHSFMATLFEIAHNPTGSVKLVLAMRADFLDRFSPFPELAKLIEKNIDLVTDMHADELRLAIEQPAARHGVVFDAGLVEEIIKEVQGQAGSLPLLQYTLDLLWEEERRNDGLTDRHLKTHTYRDLGGIRGALHKRAEEIYDSFGNKEEPKHASEKQETVRHIFLRLVDLSGTGSDDTVWRPVRRRATMSSFKKPEEQELTRQLINQKLLVSNRDGVEATVEVAHEALFSSWDRFKKWIEGGKQVIFTKNRLADDARRWDCRQEEDKVAAEDELLSGSRLGQALEMRAHGDFATIGVELNEKETKFLDASAARREHRAQKERDRQERELAKERQLREAEAARAREAEARLAAEQAGAGKARLATAHELVLQGEKYLPSDPTLSLILAYHAAMEAKASGETMPKEAVDLLRRALRANPRIFPGPGAQTMAWSPDGTKLLAGSQDHQARIWDLATQKELGVLKGHTGWLEDVAWSPDGRLLATAARDGAARLWNADSFDLIETIPCNNSTVQTVSFHPYQSLLAVAHTAGLDNTPMKVRVWDINLRREIFDVPGFRASFSPDGTKLACGDGQGWGSVQLYDINGKLLATLLGHERYIHSLAWSPDSARLATASVDNTVRVWDAAQGTIIRALTNAFALCATWSPDGRYLASGGGNREVRLWDAKTLTDWDAITAVRSLTGEPIQGSGASDYIIGLAWNPSATYLAVADRGGWLKKDANVCARIYPTRVFDARTADDLLQAAKESMVLPLSLAEARSLIEKKASEPVIGN